MKVLRFFLPRIEYILFIAIFWGMIANGPRILNFDGDLPRHILTGNLILQTRQVSTTDLFSFRTAGHPSFPHEWFSQVLFALAYDWLGLNGIVLLTGLVIMLMALKLSTPLVAVSLGLLGFFSAPLTIWAQTLRMKVIPNPLRGRTFALPRTAGDDRPH